MAELRFQATGTATIEEQALRLLHLRGGQGVTPLEAAAYVFNTPRPSQVQIRDVTSALCKLAEEGRARVAT